MSKADVIIGVKEVPMTDLIANKTYLFFSHTHKGQSHNMPMLSAIRDKVRCTLCVSGIKMDTDDRFRKLHWSIMNC